MSRPTFKKSLYQYTSGPDKAPGEIKSTSFMSPFSRSRNYSESQTKNTKQLIAQRFSVYISQNNMGTRKKRLLTGNSLGVHTSGGSGSVLKAHASTSIDRHFAQQKYRKAKQLLAAEQFDLAIPHLRSIVDGIPDFTHRKECYFWLAFCLNRTKRPSQALAIIEQCLVHFPKYFDGFLLKGKLALQQKRHALAVESFLSAIQLDGKKSSAYLELGECYMDLNDSEKALEIWRRGCFEAPESMSLPIRIVEVNCTIGSLPGCQQLLVKMQRVDGASLSDVLYARAKLSLARGSHEEALIQLEECLKHNSSRSSVTKALIEVIQLSIMKRDYYAANHAYERANILNVDFKQIKLYGQLLQGIMLLIKKKFDEGVKILQNLLKISRSQLGNLFVLCHKHLAYGYFKLGEHCLAVKHYRKVPAEYLDRVSSYNQLLAQAIILADVEADYDEARQKLEAAKGFYQQKVEPFVYQAITHIAEATQVCPVDQTLINTAGHLALQILGRAEEINPNNSNLLYNRTIIYFYFENWQKAHIDINKCIQKAEQNLPKYFYLRGLCFSCVRDFKKAINEFSIAISLNTDYAAAYLQRARAYLFSDDVHEGFSDLKIYIHMNPGDRQVHKWIGDLLYESHSYKDALKAYTEMGQCTSFEARIMKIKCLLRTQSLPTIIKHIRGLTGSCHQDEQKLGIDIICLKIVGILTKQDQKQLSCLLSQLNLKLEQNKVGFVMSLVDCMFMLGLASFYLRNFDESLQAFKLLDDLFMSLQSKDDSIIKTQNQFDTQIQRKDILLCLFITKLAQGPLALVLESLTAMARLPQLKSMTQELKKIIMACKKDHSCEEHISISMSGRQFKLRPVDLRIGPNLIMTAHFYFKPYHSHASQLEALTVARQLMLKLKVANQGYLQAGSVDNMPEGPWIKRNSHGVVFTDDVLSESDLSLDTLTSRSKECDPNLNSNQISQQQMQYRKKQFLQQMQLDEKVKERLQRIVTREQ